MLNVVTPTISIIVGEAYSGGAVAFIGADRIAMLSTAQFTSISPRSCDLIINSEQKKQAYNNSIYTPDQLKEIGIIDKVIAPNLNENKINKNDVYDKIKKYIELELLLLSKEDKKAMINKRKERFYNGDYSKWVKNQ